MESKKNKLIKSSDVISMFPTFVWKIQLSIESYGELNTRILDDLNKLRLASPATIPGEAWQSNHALHKLKEFGELISYINDTVNTTLQFLKIGYDAFELTGCWATISTKGAAHRVHSHPNNFLSGVYYVQTQAGADSINFHDPRIQSGIIRPPVTELTAENTDQVVVTVKEGTLLIFPSYLQHSVDPNTSK